MPIKFRCPHCRQFLGISRAKAGGIADCPMCGKSVRVPDLDGSVRPLPKPEMDLEDPELVDALGELAGIGGTEPTDAPPRTPRRERRPTPILPAAAPAPQPVQLQPLEPATPLVLDPPPPPEPRPVRSDQGAGTGFETFSSVAPGKPKRRDATAPAESRSRRSALRRSSRPRMPAFRWLVASALAGLLVVGSVGVILMNRGEPASSTAAESSQPVAPAPDAAEPDPAAGSEQEPAFTGRITYVSEAGDARPDDGARVIVLPTQRRGTIRFDSDGFMVGSGAVDSDVAAAALRALGGDLAIADAQGQYAVRLPQAGSYEVVAISRHQSRPWQVGVEAPTQEMLERFFLRPSTLLGQLAYVVETIQYRGQGTSPRDFAFERQ